MCSVGCVMRQPCAVSYVRVNTLVCEVAQAQQRLQLLLPHASIERDSSVRDVLVVRAAAQPSSEVEPLPLHIYVDRQAGSAIMRGSHLYAPGILGSNRAFDVGDECAVHMVVSSCVVLRGHCAPVDPDQVLWLGNGRLQVARTGVFNAVKKCPPGPGVTMTQRRWPAVSLNQLDSVDWCLPQNLPSAVAVHVLDPQPNERVLDMCAAPGGKSSHIAARMHNQGEVVCVDRHSARVTRLRATLARLQATCCVVRQADSTSLTDPTWFDRVLLDAPCSALGQRPLTQPLLCAERRADHAKLQMKLFAQAVDLVRVNGVLVYSTCSLCPAENDAIVLWALRRWPQLRLQPQTPCLAPHLLPDNDVAVQLFDPQQFCQRHSQQQRCIDDPNWDDVTLYNDCAPLQQQPQHDCIGFFIAKFVKTDGK